VLLDEQEKRPQRGGELRSLIRTPEGKGAQSSRKSLALNTVKHRRA